MTLGPAFGAPPPSDFNEPHQLHGEAPVPVDPDEARETERVAAAHRAPGSSSAEPPVKPGGLRGWLRRLLGSE